MYLSRIATLVVASVLTSFSALTTPAPAHAQPKQPAEEADNVIPVAAAVQVLRNTELSLGGTKLTVSSIEYAQQGTTIYLLPVWVVAKVESFVPSSNRWEELPPGTPRPTKAGPTPPRLRVHLANLLAQENTRAAVEKRLRDHLANGEGVKPEQIRLRSPTFNPRGYRIALAAPGAAGDVGEVMLSRTIVVPPAVAEDNGRVIFDLIPENIAGLQAVNAEPVQLRETYLKLSGQMKARFEKQQYLANFQVVSAAVTSLQNDLKSAQPTGQSAPEVFLQVPLGGTVDGKAAATAAFSQYLVGSISVREGANINAGLLSEFSERVLGRVLSQVELKRTEDTKRVSVMFGNMATLSATVGEIKTLANATKTEREKQLKSALDEMEAQRTGRKSEYSGSVGVRFGPLGGKVEAGYGKATEDEKATRRKEELETLNRGIDELAKHFDGRLPTLTGVRFDQKALDESMQAVQVELQQNVFTSGWSQHDWTGIKLTTTAGLAVSPELLLRQLEVAQARYAEFEKLLGTPEKVNELRDLVGEARKATDEAKAAAGRVARDGDASSGRGELERRLKNLEFGMVAVPRATLSDARRSLRECVAFSPDGKIVTGGVQFWDAATGKVLIDSQNTGADVNSISFSPNGKTIARALVSSKTATLIDVATGANQLDLKGHTDTVSVVSFSPDGKTVATSSADKTVRLWDTTTGKELFVLEGDGGSGSSRTILSFSPDGKLLATAINKNVCLWNVTTGGAPTVLTSQGAWINCVAFSPDGKTLIAGNNFPEARLWDVATGKELAVHKCERPVRSASFSPDGKRIVIGEEGGGTYLWTMDGKELRYKKTLKGHENTVLSVSFSPDGKTVATASYDHTARLWDAESGIELAVLKGHTNSVMSVKFSPDGKTIATVSHDRTIRLWSLYP